MWSNVKFPPLKMRKNIHFNQRTTFFFLLFSAHISYGKGKYLNQTGFFLFSAHISYGKGKYLNQTGFFFFTKFAKILFIFKFKGVTHRIQPT